MQSIIDEHKTLLTVTRQRVSIQLFFFIYSVGFLGSAVSIFTNPLNSLSGKFQQIIPVAVVIIISLGFLSILYRFVGRYAWIDTGIFAMAVLLYVIIAAVSIGKILSIMIWVPMFVVFLFGLMNLKLSYFFLILHFAVTVGFNIRYPEYRYDVTRSTYASFYTILIILLFAVPKVVNLFLKYQQMILNDNELLHRKNTQVNFLLEEIKIKNKTLTDIAFQDSLTGLLNRQGFISTLENLLKQANSSPVIVLLLDLIQFRDINNVYGYIVGDDILKLMADSFTNKNLECAATARIGNDIFAFAVTGMSMDEMKTLIKKDFEKPVFLKEQGINIRYRLGISCCTENNKTPEMFLNEADIALSRAKEITTANYFIYDAVLEKEIKKRLTLVSALEKAIESKALHMVYQPIYDIHTSTVIGVEALSRWKDDVFGDIPPDVFIALAERSSLMTRLGMLIIQSMCTFCSHCKEKGLNLFVTVNISYRQLELENFAQLFIEQIKANNLSPSSIAIEITESVLIDNFQLVIDHLSLLRRAGFKIYLDDFGTGYSSLNYLDQLPIDVLKVDKLFIDEILFSERKKQLLETIVSLAKKLNLTVLAEGVETPEQAAVLKQMDIALVQGYYFSKPLTEQSLFTLVEQQTK